MGYFPNRDTTKVVEPFNTNDVEEASSTVTYVGNEADFGNWVIEKVNTSSSIVISYASRKNNPTYVTYDTAWTARASLTYQDHSLAF